MSWIPWATIPVEISLRVYVYQKVNGWIEEMPTPVHVRVTEAAKIWFWTIDTGRVVDEFDVPGSFTITLSGRRPYHFTLTAEGFRPCSFFYNFTDNRTTYVTTAWYDGMERLSVRRESMDRFPLLYESYSTGPEMAVSAKKTATILATSLGQIKDSTWESLEGKEVPVGTSVRISGTLYTDAYAKVGSGKTINIYHKLGTGAYSKISTATTDGDSNFHVNYTLADVGSHTFYAEFPGDAAYEGCKEKTFAKAR